MDRSPFRNHSRARATTLEQLLELNENGAQWSFSDFLLVGR